MDRKWITILVCLGFFVSLGQVPCVQGAGEEFENLEFFLDQYIKETQDGAQRSQIMDRYAIKALGLLYRQNAELIRLSGETLKALQQLVEGQEKEIRALEHQIRELRNELKGPIGGTAQGGALSTGAGQ